MRASSSGAKYVVGSNYAVLALGTVNGVLVARLLGPAARGELALVLAWLGIAFVVGELGQSAAVAYFTAKAPGRAREVRRRARRLMLGGGTLAGLLVVGFAVFWSSALNLRGMSTAVLLSLLLINAVGAPSVYSLQATSLRAWSLVRFSQVAAYTALLVLLWGADRVDLGTVLLAYVLSFVVQIALAAMWTRPREEPGLPTLGDGPLLRFGANTMLGAVPLTMMTHSDRLILGAHSSTTEVGQYAIAVSWVSLVLPFASAMGSVRFMSIARMGGGSAERSGYLRVGGAIVAGLLVSGASAPWVVPTLFGEEYLSAAWLSWWLLPAAFFQALNQVLSDEMRGHGRLGVIAGAAWVGLISFLVAAPFLAWAGAEGVALAIGLGQGVMLLMLVRAKRHAGSSV